jgi:hypothetical protein
MKNSVSTDSPANLAKTAKKARSSTRSLYASLGGKVAPLTAVETDPEEIEERAAIFEFESGIPRPVAEWLANIWFLEPPQNMSPEIWREFLKIATESTEYWAKQVADEDSRVWVVGKRWVYDHQTGKAYTPHEAAQILMER